MSVYRSLLQAVFCLAAVVLISGCHSELAPIPPRVTVEEMQVYEAWLRDHKQRSPQVAIKVFPLTQPIPPNSIGPGSSHDWAKDERNSLRRDGIPASAFDELANLGDARYGLPTPFDPKIATTAEPTCWPTESEPETTRVGFSRVVFSRDGTTAFLHVSDAHFFPKVSGGGSARYQLATKQGGSWSFKSVGPVRLF